MEKRLPNACAQESKSGLLGFLTSRTSFSQLQIHVTTLAYRASL